MKLTENDYLAFLKLKIPRDLVDRAQIFRVDRREAAEEYGITLDGDGGVCFPAFLPPLNGNDTKHAVSYTIRQDNPQHDPDGKALRKYVATIGRQYPYIAPTDSDRFADRSVPVIIVEAQKSALAVARWAEDHGRRFIVVAIAGCYGWRGKVGIAPNEKGEREEIKGLNPTLGAVCEGHRAYILLDANAATNPHVRHGRAWLAETLIKDKITSDVRILSLPPSITAPHYNGPDDFLAAYGDAAFDEVFESAERFHPSETRAGETLGSCSVAELFAAREKEVSWLIWPFAAVGLSTILDALPKCGKTVLILRGIHASLNGMPFLNYATKKVRAVYVSEQSRPSLALQMREIGFTGHESIDDLRIITREDWSRFVYTEFLVNLENEFIKTGAYNFLVIDTFHTVARLEDEKDASEVNKVGNLTLDVAARNSLGLTLGRHDRKSGGDVGVSGRSSIQLSGLVDSILHLVRAPNQVNQRKLEAISRVPIPNEQMIELLPTGEYFNWGVPVAESVNRETFVRNWYAEDPDITAPEIIARFAAMVPPIVVTERTARRDLAKAKTDK